MTSSRVVVFFGTENFSAPSLHALIVAGYTVSYVITKPDSVRGRGQIMQSPEVKNIALEHGIPILQPVKLADIHDELAALDAPVGVLVAYGKIIPQSIIDLFKPGIINVHPSLLPKYRGPSPLEAAILHGDRETGISIMQLSAAMDSGPIYQQITLPLTGFETKPELYDVCAQKGADLLLETLPRILSNTFDPTPQQETEASYCSLITKHDGILDYEHKTAVQLEREVRAYLNFPKSHVILHSQPVIVVSAHIGDGSEPLTLACHENTHLSIDELIAPSGKKMNAEAFIRGYRNNQAN